MRGNIIRKRFLSYSRYWSGTSWKWRLTWGNISKERFISVEIEKTPPCIRLAGLKFELTNQESAAATRTEGAAAVCKACISQASSSPLPRILK